MKTYLENGFATYGGINFRNSWFIYTDRGTGGSTWTLEFAGVEDNIEALELERLPNGMFSYGVELVDIVYYYLKSTSSSLWWNIFAPRPFVNQRNVWQILFQGNNQDLLRRRQRMEIAELGCTGSFMNLGDLLETPRYLTSQFSGVSHTTGGFDHTGELKNIMTHAVDFFAPSTTTSLPRNGGSTPLALSSLYVLSEISRGNYGGEVIGGVQSDRDQFTVRRGDQSFYDTLRAFCEQSAIRLGYRFEHSGSGPSSQIRVIFDVKTITQSRDYGKTVATPDKSLNLDQAISFSSVVVRGDNILKAETRYETTSDKDATQIVRIKEGARASRSFNFEPILINNPIDIQDNNRDDEWPFFKAPIRQTNQIFTTTVSIPGATSDDLVKVHEKTKVTWGAGATEYVVVDPDGLKNPVSARDFKNNTRTQITYYLQINDSQVNGSITAAITSALIDVFSNEKNAIIEVEWCISQNTKVLADYICGRYSLSGEIATAFPQINWGRAIPISMEIDFLADKVKHKYMMVK